MKSVPARLSFNVVTHIKSTLLVAASILLFSCDAEDTGGESMQDRVGHEFFMGNHLNLKLASDTFSDYWTQITPENVGVWGAIEGYRNTFVWDTLDAHYDYARQHNMLIKAHTFVWGSQAPNWINNLFGEQAAVEIEEWISAYCARYPDTDMIDVVNEALPGHSPMRAAAQAFGDDWVVESFKLTKKYCPNAILILNDYYLLSYETDDFVAWAKPIIDSGYVDAIGVEAHGLENNTSPETVATNLDTLADLGLPIYISEFDVAMTDDQDQLKIIQDLFPIFYHHDSVVGITFLGDKEGATWRTGAHLVNGDETPRPALTWVMDYISQNPK